MIGLAQRRHDLFRTRQRHERIINTWGYDTGDVKRNVTKPPGYEYWGRRPGCYDVGKESKRLTHSIERARERQLLFAVGAGI